MHQWGDETVDWKGIDASACYIATFLKRWGRVGVRDFKEKYGTVRVYLTFGWHQLHCLTHPGYVYSQYPKWLWRLDCRYISKIFKMLNILIIPYHIWLYKCAYRNAVGKWPHLRVEILHGADYLQLLSNCDDIKLRWHPHQFNDADKQRIGKHILDYIDTADKTILRLLDQGYERNIERNNDEKT